MEIQLYCATRITDKKTIVGYVVPSEFVVDLDTTETIEIRYKFFIVHPYFANMKKNENGTATFAMYEEWIDWSTLRPYNPEEKKEPVDAKQKVKKKAKEN